MTTLVEEKSLQVADKMSEKLVPVSPIWTRRNSGSRKLGVYGMGSIPPNNSKLRLRKWSAPIFGSLKMR